MHDPQTLVCSFPSYAQRQWMEKRRWIPGWLTRIYLFEIWHHDPCKDGTDDSCGWFMRARHGKPEVLAQIVRSYEFDFDRTFTSDTSGKVYYCGFFMPENDGAGMPNMSVAGIVLNLFYLAALKHFDSQPKAMRFCQRNLAGILLFAENPTDSLRDGIVQKFGSDGKREERIRGLASSIYAWILRADMPWWRHPRWHVHHWSIQFHPWLRFRRWLTQRCAVCAKRIRPSDVTVSDYRGLTCPRCQNPAQTPRPS